MSKSWHSDKKVIRLRCPAEGSRLPTSRLWEAQHYKEEWEADPSLTLSPPTGSECGAIRIASTGRAAKERPGCLGDFTLVPDSYSQGRHVRRKPITMSCTTCDLCVYCTDLHRCTGRRRARGSICMHTVDAG